MAILKGIGLQIANHLKYLPPCAPQCRFVRPGICLDSSYLPLPSHSPHSTASLNPPPRHTVDLRATATARLELLDKAEEHPANLLRYKICAIFREWGRRDLADAEAIIDALPHSEIWCPSMNPADIREALRYAALIGASAADPEQAWRRLIHHESGLACEILPTERLGQFLACDGGQ